MPTNNYRILRPEEANKTILNALIERIMAYLDRKMRVKFRIRLADTSPRKERKIQTVVKLKENVQLHSSYISKLYCVFPRPFGYVD